MDLFVITGMNGAATNAFVTDSSFSSVFGNTEPAGKNSGQ